MMRYDFYPGQRVFCDNDWFHPSIRDWGNQIPTCEASYYTVKEVCLCPDVVTGEMGFGLLLEELSNPDDQLCFSGSRFVPYWVLTQAELDALEKIFEECEKRLEQEESAKEAAPPEPPPPTPLGKGVWFTGPGARKFGTRPARNWRAVVAARLWRAPRPIRREINAGSVARLRAFITATEPVVFNSVVSLEPGELAAELNLMRVVPGLWPSGALTAVLHECGLLGRWEARVLGDALRRPSFDPRWRTRLHRLANVVLAHVAHAVPAAAAPPETACKPG
jgi:hypothetical protein